MTMFFFFKVATQQKKKYYGSALVSEKQVLILQVQYSRGDAQLSHCEPWQQIWSLIFKQNWTIVSLLSNHKLNDMWQLAAVLSVVLQTREAFRT